MCEKKESLELIWKNITVLLADPRMDNYYTYWIPQDDLDMNEFKENLAQVEGIGNITYYEDHKNLMSEWLKNPPDFVFNQCDEGYLNDEDFEPHLTAFMDMIGVPYTGPGSFGLVTVKDKSLVRGAAMSVGVPVPVEVYIGVDDDIPSKIPEDMVYPAFAKLANSSGSVGVIPQGVAKNREEAIAGLECLRKLHPTRPLLLQEFLTGKELSIGMVGNPECGDFEVFPPVEVDYGGLDSKYPPIQLEEFKRDGDSEFWQQVKEVPAQLSERQLADLKEYAKRLFVRTHCKDFARMDFRMDSAGTLKVMDINPNCWLGGKYRMMAEWAGYSWPQVLKKILATAQHRHVKYVKAKEEAREFERQRQETNLKKLGFDAPPPLPNNTLNNTSSQSGSEAPALSTQKP